MSDYLETLRVIRASGRRPAAGSAVERSGLDAFRDLFSELSEENVRAKLRGVYAADVYFNDTLKEVRGVERLEPYLIESARSVKFCRVEIADAVSGDGDHYLRWIMELELERFKKGETLRSIGMSHLRLDEDGKVLLHQDYWDAASGLFEHVPVVGYAIRRVKARL